MKTITIINAYGEKNIGDAAIQESALNFLSGLVSEEDKIFLLSVDSSHYKKSSHLYAKIIQCKLPYGYAIESSSKPISRIHKLYRFVKIAIVSLSLTFFHEFNKNYIKTRATYKYIYAIMKADIIVGMGGGYFTSRYGMSDNFGLLLTLLPVYIAKKYHKKIIFLPLTFGPFATETHKKMTHKILENTTVFCRDKISQNKIEKLNTTKNSVKTIYVPDLALFLDIPMHKENEMRNAYYVITAREWLDKNKQAQYENELTKFISKNWQEKKQKAIFIPMAFNAIEDDDRRVAKRIDKSLNNQNIFSIYYANNPLEVQKILQKATFAVCTRMHSAILSFTTETPFITIAYSQKTNNFLKDFGLSEWNINIEDFSAKILDDKVEKLRRNNNYADYINRIRTHKSRLTEQKKDFQLLLKNYIN